MGADGLTPFRRLKWRKFGPLLAGFGERVWFMDPILKRANKFNPRCTEVRLLGFCLKSSRCIVVVFDGRFRMVRTIKRANADDRWKVVSQKEGSSVAVSPLLKKRWETRNQMIGPKPDDQKELCIVNRTLRWCKDGLVFAAKRRHGREVVDELRLSSRNQYRLRPRGATRCQRDELKPLDDVKTTSVSPPNSRSVARISKVELPQTCQISVHPCCLPWRLLLGCLDPFAFPLILTRFFLPGATRISDSSTSILTSRSSSFRTSLARPFHTSS